MTDIGDITLDSLAEAIRPYNERLLLLSRLNAANKIIASQNAALALANAALSLARHELRGAWYHSMPPRSFEADPTIKKIDAAMAAIKGEPCK